VQQQNRDVLNSRNKLKDEKAELLGAYKQAVRRIQNGDADGQEKAREAVEDIMEYNKKIGDPYYGISYANMYRSLTGSVAEAKYDIQGMGLNEVESLYADKLLNPK
jgi:Zn-dependent oligopeptidase